MQERQIGPVTCLVATAPARPLATMIIAHGYAMDAEHLAPLACAMGLPATLYFPRGLRPAPGGGRCWWSLDEERRRESIAQGPRDLCDEYPAGRAEARAALIAVARQARNEHPDLALILAGFSQGGMLACDTLLHEELNAEGLILLSSSRIAIDDWRPRLQRLRGISVLVAHGTQDPDLSFGAGERLRDELLKIGAKVTWLPFEGGHEIPFTIWRAIKRQVLQITQHDN
jgi:phospholipase/carboxylesterase